MAINFWMTNHVPCNIAMINKKAHKMNGKEPLIGSIYNYDTFQMQSIDCQVQIDHINMDLYKRMRVVAA